MEIGYYVLGEILLGFLMGALAFFLVAAATGAPDRRISWVLHPIVGCSVAIYFFRELGILSVLIGIVSCLAAYRLLYWFFNQLSPTFYEH